jgi:hypothetical protein
MGRMEWALDGMVPAPAAEVGMENEINDPQDTQTGEARSCVHQQETVFAVWS